MRTIEIPGRPTLELAHLLLDVNGTLTNRGDLIDDVETKLRRLQETFNVHLLSADTFGSLTRVASTLGVHASIARDAGEGRRRARARSAVLRRDRQRSKRRGHAQRGGTGHRRDRPRGRSYRHTRSRRHRLPLDRRRTRAPPRRPGTRGDPTPVAPAEMRDSVSGLLAAVQSFGNLAASAIAGLLWTLASPQVAFLYFAPGMLASLAALALIRGPSDQATKRGTHVRRAPSSPVTGVRAASPS